jgi:hypothetical protein
MNETERTPIRKQEAGSAEVLPARLLLRRLKIEAELKRRGAAIAVSGNTIRLRAPHQLAVITLSEPAAGATRVAIEAVPTEPLLHAELPEFARVRNEQIKPIRIEVADNRLACVTWQRDFADDPDPAPVAEALLAVGAECESVRGGVMTGFLPAKPADVPASLETTREDA